MMKAIFLDRDGTIIKDKNYLSCPSQLEWMPGAIEGLKLLKNHHYELFLITNQSGIGRGYFSVAQLENVHLSLNNMMELAGIGKFKSIEFCPHTPEDQCECRKPKPTLIEKLITRFQINRKTSWMVGDKDIDVLSGKNAQIHSALIGGSSQEWAKQNNFSFFCDLEAFAQKIIQTKNEEMI